MSARLAGMLIGGLLFALYLVLLTRASLDAAMGNPPVLGGWKSLAVVLVLGIALLAIAAARSAGWTGRRLLAWIATHAEVLSVSGLTLAAFAIRVYGISDNLPYINYPDEPAVADRRTTVVRLRVPAVVGLCVPVADDVLGLRRGHGTRERSGD